MEEKGEMLGSIQFEDNPKPPKQDKDSKLSIAYFINSNCI